MQLAQQKFQPRNGAHQKCAPTNMLIHTVLQICVLCGISVIQSSNQVLANRLITYVAEYNQIRDVHPTASTRYSAMLCAVHMSHAFLRHLTKNKNRERNLVPTIHTPMIPFRHVSADKTYH